MRQCNRTMALLLSSVFANTTPYISPGLYDHGFLYHTTQGAGSFETTVNVVVESDSDLRRAANGTIERGLG